MMTYQKIHNNLPPKDKDNKNTSNPQTNENAAKLSGENELLARSISELKGNLNYAQQEIMNKEHEILNLNNRLMELESQLHRYEYLRGELDQVENIDTKISSLDSEAKSLRVENEELKSSINYYKGHVQTLYLILIIVAIM